MTISTIYAADGTAVALDLNDTVRFLHPDPPTVRITPPPRRPRAVGETRVRIPRTIGIVDAPLATDALPPFAAYANRKPVGRHRRADQPGLFARLLVLFGFGRKDGA